MLSMLRKICNFLLNETNYSVYVKIYSLPKHRLLIEQSAVKRSSKSLIIPCRNFLILNQHYKLLYQKAVGDLRAINSTLEIIKFLQFSTMGRSTQILLTIGDGLKAIICTPYMNHCFSKIPALLTMSLSAQMYGPGLRITIRSSC